MVIVIPSFWDKVVYPVLISMPATVKVAVMVEFPVPLPSKVAMSEEPGVVASLLPPEVVDHLVSSLKFPAPAPIQYFVAA